VRIQRAPRSLAPGRINQHSIDKVRRRNVYSANKSGPLYGTRRHTLLGAQTHAQIIVIALSASLTLRPVIYARVIRACAAEARPIIGNFHLSDMDEVRQPCLFEIAFALPHSDDCAYV
jgi:hypothetical protein